MKVNPRTHGARYVAGEGREVLRNWPEKDVRILVLATSVQTARVVIASIGPLTSEELHSRGLNVDIECTHPKMGFLVQEAAEKSGYLFQLKVSRPVSSETV